MSKFKTVSAWGLAILLVGLAGGCSPAGGELPRVSVGAGSPLTDAPTETASSGASPETDDAAPARRVAYFDGNGSFAATAQSVVPPYDASGDGYTLSFTDAEIATVAGAVLGDMLGYRYQLHPAVQGTMTLQSSSPIDRDALLPALETSLRLRGYALIDVSSVFHIVPMAEAPKRVTAIRQDIPASVALPGFGVQIVPLQYTSPTEMRKVLDLFAPQGGILRVDDARNLLILAGTSQELSTMLQAVETFDVSWLEGMSFALYSLQYVDAQTLTDELLQIFGDANSPMAGTIRLIPIPRLNAILGVSPQPGYLRQVEEWVGRLDLGGSAPGRRIYVYEVKNARAGDLASALGNILTTQGQRQGAGTTPPLAGQTNTIPSVRPGGAPGSTSQGANPQAATGQQSVFDAGGLRIMANDEANSLLILATPSEFGVVEAALRQMDVRPRQVLIEATLAEVTLTDELRYGVQWFFESGDNRVTLSDSASGGASARFPGFSYIFSGPANARAVLNALSSVTNVDVVSSPKLMVLNNQSATLQVGDQVPVAVQSSVSSLDPNAPIVNTVQFRDTGVILTVTPRIGEGGAVMLDITQEVSDVVSTTTSGIDSPTIQQRKISTSVVVQDGDTIALGGLIRETVSRGKSGIPLLMDLPLVGGLFSSNNRTRRRTELVILITPRIAKDTRQAREILDYLKGQFQAVLGPDTGE